jgi:RimJ/RimL family protein N-acetyltransferase
MIETDRLTLRPWRETDRPGWRSMMAEPEVAYWLGGAMTPAQVDAAFEHWIGDIEAQGFGMWAAERKADGALLGSIGVRRIPIAWGHPMSGEVEIGWRLVREAWGHGYASEGAAACLAFGFSRLDLGEIVSFTADTNTRSEAVMRRIGMTRDPSRDFDHPQLAIGHPLRRHIVYVARRPTSRD